MNILLAATHFFPEFGGIESSLYYMSKALRKEGHSPVILAEKSRPDLPLLDEIEGIKILRYLPMRWRGVTTVVQPFADSAIIDKELKKIIQQKNIDSIWARHPYFVCSAVKSNFKGKIIYIPPMAKRVFSENEIISNDNNSLRSAAVKAVTGIKSLVIEKFEIEALKKATKIVVFSDMVKRIFIDRYKIREEDFKIIPPGVDIDKFKPQSKDLNLSKNLGLDEKSRLLLYVGRVTKGKNVGLLIKAFSILKDADTFLIIIGTGSQMPYFVDLADNLGIGGRVKFLGFKDDVVPFYNLADFLIVPSTLEGFGHIFLEAMSCGLPCVAFKASYPEVKVASSEIVVDGKSGFLADKATAENLAATISCALSISAEERKKMSDFSREYCLKKYRWGKFIKEVVAI